MTRFAKNNVNLLALLIQFLDEFYVDIGNSGKFLRCEYTRRVSELSLSIQAGAFCVK